jgi:hypothetical protein
MLLRFTVLLAIAVVVSSCLGADGFQPDVPTDSPPVISRVDPNAGRPGDPITIFGFGYTTSVPENIIIIGGASTSATSYRLLSTITSGEIEAITANVPEDAEIGEGPIYVQVHGNSSNSDVSFTVTP